MQDEKSAKITEEMAPAGYWNFAITMKRWIGDGKNNTKYESETARTDGIKIERRCFSVFRPVSKIKHESNLSR